MLVNQVQTSDTIKRLYQRSPGWSGVYYAMSVCFYLLYANRRLKFSLKKSGLFIFNLQRNPDQTDFYDTRCSRIENLLSYRQINKKKEAKRKEKRKNMRERRKTA